MATADVAAPRAADPKRALLKFALLAIAGGAVLIIASFVLDLSILTKAGGVIGALGVLAFAVQLVWASLHESMIGMVGLALVTFWLLVCFLAPVLPVADPNATMSPGFMQEFAVPNAETGEVVILQQGYGYPGDVTPTGETLWLGMDQKSRDMLSRIVWGGPSVLFWATAATVVAYLIGMAMGVCAGYFGGWTDEIISFVGNILLSFPVMVLYVLVVAALGASGFTIIIAVTFASAPGIMRIVRGLVLDLRTRDYIAAAQTRGESSLYIMLVELLPNARGPLIVDICVRLGYTIIAIALLGYLGLGLPPPNPDWGKMIAEAQPLGASAPHILILPAFAVSSLVLGLNLLADGLREISMRD